MMILLNILTASIVFRCMSTQINGMLVYHTLGFSMNKYMYKVGFANLKFLNKTIKKSMHKHEITSSSIIISTTEKMIANKL